MAVRGKPRRDTAMLGVLGGMGPAATIDFMSKVIAVTAAERDQDHIPMFVSSSTGTPDRTEAILNNGPDPLPHMLRGIAALEQAGASLIAIPCNTAHYWFPQLSSFARVRLVSIIEALATELQPAFPKGSRLGLLATRGTYAAGIYPRGLPAYSVEIPPEEDQKAVAHAIAGVKAGFHQEARTLLEPVAVRLLEKGCTAIVMACTELPLVLRESPYTAQYCLLDPTAALARMCVREWYLTSQRTCSNSFARVPSG